MAFISVFVNDAQAQDPFEIHVYDYETLKPGQFTLEQAPVLLAPLAQNNLTARWPPPTTSFT